MLLLNRPGFSGGSIIYTVALLVYLRYQ